MKLNIAFFGSSLVSSYWNGAATYYRGIIKALAKLDYKITFFEPDIYDRQENRDMEDPEWAKVRIYNPTSDDLAKVLKESRSADIIVKASGVGAFDPELEKMVLKDKQAGQLIIFWDVDAPATLDRVQNNPADPFKQLIPQYDLILTYGGGEPVRQAYLQLKANACIPIYNALDPETHFPVSPEVKFVSDIAFLGNRLPDREARVDDFFFDAARKLPAKKFLLGGSGWHDKQMPENVNYIGHVGTLQHNTFNCTPRTVLNISRESMARYGFSPATRVFEAAGAGACIITDAWDGIDFFFVPGKEILIANSGDEVAEILRRLSPEEARQIGDAALKRVLKSHTYDFRAKQVHELIKQKFLLAA